MTHASTRSLAILMTAAACVFCLWGPSYSSEYSAEPTARELGEQVDVLQIVAELKLTEKQASLLATKVTVTKEKREGLRKEEEAVLEGIKKPLSQMRDKLAAGEEIPDSLSDTMDAKLRELEDIRRQAWAALQWAANSVVQTLTSGQTREITRTPETKRRAAEMVQLIRSSPEEEWPRTLNQLTDELLEVRKIDKQEEWSRAEANATKDLTGEEKDKALKEVHSRREAEITQMQTEIGQTLAAIRTQDPRGLSVAVNNLALALRPQVAVRAQLTAMIVRVLESPSAEAALKARLEHMKKAADEENPIP